MATPVRALLGTALVVGATGCGGARPADDSPAHRATAPESAVSTVTVQVRPSTSSLEAALRRRFEHERLAIDHVSCARPPGKQKRYRGSPIFRCVANFGDPHLPVYCAAAVGGRLVTDREVAAMRCRATRVQPVWREQA